MEREQLLGVVERKLRATCLPRLPVDFDARYERRVPATVSTDTAAIEADTARLRSALAEPTRSQFRDASRRAGRGQVRFLGRTVEFDPPTDVDWFDSRFDGLPLLWRLKLYAFEPLRWALLGFADPDAAPARVTDTFDAWLSDWTGTQRIGDPGYLRGGWTPWAVSLRIQTLARYLSWRGTGGSGDAAGRGQPTDAVVAEVYKNALFLANHVERGVGGNHLVENGAALLTAGVLFPDAGPVWLEGGLDVLERAARRQFLDDGCHFERSPMYHVLVTTRYVAACSLLESSGREVPAWLAETTCRAVAFLDEIRPPDGRIPLFNDAVFGQALPLEACLSYASATGVGPETAGVDASRTGATRPSGYYWLDTDAGRMLVDGGPVGPPHLPGHSHSDTLSFVLWAGDTRMITDTGTYEYTPGKRRQYARGVAGHNTVQVGEREPIPVGGQYLMGPRTELSVEFREGTPPVFRGHYETAASAPASYWHARSVVAGDAWWLVWDRVGGPDAAADPVTSRLHFHPDVSVDVADRTDAVATTTADSGVGEKPTRLRVHGVGADDVRTARTEYYPRFGVARSRTTLESLVNPDGTPVSLGYLLVAGESGVPESVIVDEGYPTALRRPDGEQPLPDVRPGSSAGDLDG